MSSHVTSIIESGLDGIAIDIECHLSNGLPTIVIVGSANRSIDEAKERLRGAFSSSQLPFPRKRITINLAPADLPKDGCGFDLAMAAAILQASQDYPASQTEGVIVLGELGLDGATRAIRGIIGNILAARQLGYRQFFVPVANLAQAELIPHIELFPVATLRQLHHHLSGEQPIKEVVTGITQLTPRLVEPENDLGSIVGQTQAKRALEVAAAGGHNLLLSGPPGTGKTMLARCLPSLLPPLTADEVLVITHLHSLASNQFDQIIDERPFRAPHHSASLAALLGGGSPASPGEISLSHQGVLLLDEFPEFHRDVIESLRQPLEDKTIRIARGRHRTVFPANFLLVATANPCPCGFYNSDRPCTCLPHHILNYQRKLSGPIVDRIDLCVDVLPTKNKKLLQDVVHGKTTTQVRARIIRARQRQSQRCRTTTLNAQLDNRSIRRYAELTPGGLHLLNTVGQRMKLSARAYFRTLKVARTIADLEDSPVTDLQHVTEALQFRQLPP